MLNCAVVWFLLWYSLVNHCVVEYVMSMSEIVTLQNISSIMFPISEHLYTLSSDSTVHAVYSGISMAAINCCALYWCVSVLMFPFTAQGFLPTMLTKLSQMDLGCLQQQNLLWMGVVWFQTKRIRGLWNTYKHIGS